MEDTRTGVMELLVARVVQVCRQVCRRMQCMQPDEDLPYAEGGEADPQQVPDQFWQVISVDMIGELLDSKGYNAVLMVVDCLSKQIHTIPTVTSLDSAGVAQLFLEHVWCHHGLLEEVIS